MRPRISSQFIHSPGFFALLNGLPFPFWQGRQVFFCGLGGISFGLLRSSTFVSGWSAGEDCEKTNGE